MPHYQVHVIVYYTSQQSNEMMVLCGRERALDIRAFHSVKKKLTPQMRHILALALLRRDPILYTLTNGSERAPVEEVLSHTLINGRVSFPTGSGNTDEARPKIAALGALNAYLQLPTISEDNLVEQWRTTNSNGNQHIYFGVNLNKIVNDVDLKVNALIANFNKNFYRVSKYRQLETFPIEKLKCKLEMADQIDSIYIRDQMWQLTQHFCDWLESSQKMRVHLLARCHFQEEMSKLLTSREFKDKLYATKLLQSHYYEQMYNALIFECQKEQAVLAPTNIACSKMYSP